jgi:hypothetical protein
MVSDVSTRQRPESQRRRARTNKSCGPDARSLCVKSCGHAAVQPDARISHPQGDGGNSASLPGESTKDTLKPSRREGRAIRQHLWSTPCAFLWRTDLRVPAGARPSLRPRLDEGACEKQNSGETRRENANPCPYPSRRGGSSSDRTAQGDWNADCSLWLLPRRTRTGFPGTNS